MIRRQIFKSVALALVCLPIITGWAYSGEDLLSELSSTVVFLHQQMPSGKRFIGTGFFVNDGQKLFLVTAEHVKNGLTAKSSVTIRVTGDKPLTFPLRQLVSGKTPVWKTHKKADVAALLLNPELKFKERYLQNHFLDLANEVQKTLISPKRPIPLTVLGFPLALGIKNSFSPISRQTRAASGLLEIPRADTKKMAIFFITQDPSVGGFSGAPVFDLNIPHGSPGGMRFITGGNITLVGIVHGTISDRTGGKFGAVTPASYISDLLKKFK